MLAVEFGLMILVSLRHAASRSVHARPVLSPGCTRRSARKTRFAGTTLRATLPESATLGMEGTSLDYRKSSRFAYAGLQELGLEIPRMTWFDWGGFLAAWVLVGGLIGLLIWLADSAVKRRRGSHQARESPMSDAFANRVALVTGGSRGIGRSTALRLASEGADVAISYASRVQEAEQVVAEIQALGRKAICVPCNVARPDDVDRLVSQTREQLGPIDLLAHCGAISNICDHADLSYELWLETIDVNLNGAFLVVFAVKDEMIARGFGRMVLVSSVAALRPRKMQIHYASSKAGVIALTRCCGEAFAPHNVRVNCVAPGLIETEMAHVLSDEAMKRIVADTPLGRIGQPDEIASVIRFLLSEESSFMTGETLSASGGRVTLP